MKSMVRWLFGMPKEEQPAQGLALDERLLLFEIRNELANVAFAIKQVAADLEAMKNQFETRLDDLETSIAEVSGDIFEMRSGVPVEDVYPYPDGPDLGDK